MKCSGDRACPFPAAKSGLCGFHLRDLTEQRSLMGSTLELLRDVPKQYGFRLGRGNTTEKRGEKCPPQ
jgi:hypothetical protein